MMGGGGGGGAADPVAVVEEYANLRRLGQSGKIRLNLNWFCLFVKIMEIKWRREKEKEGKKGNI